MSFEEILKTTDQPVDIIITGGYHSRGMKQLMDGLDINYAVIMPNVKSVDVIESKSKFYEDYMRQLSILNNTYQKFIRSSLMNESWDDPTKVIAVGFLDYDLLSELFNRYKNIETVQENVSVVQKYISDIFNAKGLDDDTVLKNIEVVEKGFLLTFLSENKERLFYVSKNTVKEINNRNEITNLREEEFVDNSTGSQKPGRIKRLHRNLSLFTKMVLMLPMMFVVGAVPGGGAAYTKEVKKKGLVNNGADTKDTDLEKVVFVDTVIEQNAEVSLHGTITLNNVYIPDGSIFKINCSDKTSVTVKDIDMTDIGELDIDIQAEGDFEVVRENGIIKIYKVLKTDFSSADKKKNELVSVLNKGKIFLASERDWNRDNTYPVIVFYGKYTKWSDVEKIEERSELIYNSNNVFYADISKFKSFISNKEINAKAFKEFLESNGLLNRNVCLDMSLLDEQDSAFFMSEESQSLFTDIMTSATFLYTDIPFYGLFPSKFSVNRQNKHNYMRSDGTIIRYPYKERNWLKDVLTTFFPNFENKTFVFIWPVESVKYTYKKLSNYDSHPEEQILANEEFKAFMDKALEYSKSGKDSIVFMPGYLLKELAVYFQDDSIADKFSDIIYGDLKDDKIFDVWYKRSTAKDVEKIEVLKIDGLTIVMYPEGNRGHNEQAYLETLMATYNYGKESFDRMLTQAGFPWQENVIYVYEGEEMQNLNVEEKLLQNPSIKKGKVTYIYDNLKRVFIELYSNVRSFFNTTVSKFEKGNWIAIESDVADTLDIARIREAVNAKVKLGFLSLTIVPVKNSVLEEEVYGNPTILEKNGVKIPVYVLKNNNGIIILVGISDTRLIWQDVLLEYAKQFLVQEENSIISFNGFPQIPARQTLSVLGKTYIPVVLSKNSENEKEMEVMGYDTVVNIEDIIARIGRKDLKYPHVAEDMRAVAENVKAVKALKRKSFFGEFFEQKSSYVGVKIASDEHIFNNELEENEFIEILNGSDIDFITVVIRDNNLNVRVLNRETTVKENLTKLSGNLHKNGKKMVLEYTFRFFDEFFKTFVRTISVDVNDIGVDGIKLDLANCSIEDIKSVLNDFENIRNELPDIEISVQVADKVWNEFKDFFDDLKITRTLSSKEELLMEGKYDLSEMNDVNYEISIYKDQQEYETRLVFLSNKRDSILLKGSYPGSLALLAEKGEDVYLDHIIDERLEEILQKVINSDSIGKLIIPVNMLYAQRLKEDTKENSNIIQAVSDLMRLFKETKGMKERMRFAYEYGTRQEVNLSQQEEEEIARILRNESDTTASSYVKEHFSYLFDYFVESKQTRISVSSSFLFGIYEANIVRKYKQGDFGKVFKFVVNPYVSRDTQQAADMRQKIFYGMLAHVSLFKEKMNIEDVFSLQPDEFIEYEQGPKRNNILNLYSSQVKAGSLYSDSMVFKEAFSILSKDALGYMDNRQDTVYKARLLLAGLMKACKKEEIEPVRPAIDPGILRIADYIFGDNITENIRKILSAS